MSRDAATSDSFGPDAQGPDDDLARLLDAFLADVEAGRAADPERLLAEHPHLADRLRALLPLLGLSGIDDGDTSKITTSWWDEDVPYPSVLLPDPPGLTDPPVLTHAPGDVGRLGRYRVLGELSRGGMGLVLKARDEDLGRDLAIKVLRGRHRRDPVSLRRFVEEAQIGGQLQHPGITPVYELGTGGNGRPLIAMKLLSGRTLAALLAERPDPSRDRERFLGIFRAICQTIAYAHARRVIHRDLKPTNVMVGTFGEVQVMDWGLAKILPFGGLADERLPTDPIQGDILIRTIRSEEQGSDSLAGSVFGTPAYMAPEQARGEFHRLNASTDVFGLGAILCEILTGRPPYQGSTPAELRAAAARADLTEASRRLDACKADPELIALARDCLAADPADRPRDGGVVEHRLASHFESVQSRLRAAEAARLEAEARAEAERLRRCLTVAVTFALLTMASLAGWGLWSHAQLEAARVDANRKALEAREQRFEALRFRYVADIRRAARLVREHRVTLATDLLAQEVPKPGEPDLRDFAWGYLLKHCHTERASLLGHEGEVYHVEFSPDDQILATCGQDRTVRLWDAATGRALRNLKGHDSEVNWVTFSPDGTVLATASDDGTLRLWETDTGLPLAYWNAHEGTAVAVLFTPDGQRVVSCGRNDGRVKIWDRDTKQLVLEFVAHDRLVENMALSPDGSILATVSHAHEGKLWGLADGTLLAALEGHHDQIQGVAFAPDGRTVATAALDNTVRLWEVPSGRPLRTLVGHLNSPYSVDFSADGRTIVSSGEDHTIRIWDVATGDLLGIHQGHTNRVWDVETARNGNVASASRDGTVKLWSLVGPRDRQIVPVENAIALQFSPDSRELLVVETKGYLSTWEVATCEPRRRLHLEPPGIPAFSGIRTAAIAGDPPVLAIADWEGRVSLWDADGTFRSLLKRPLHLVTDLVLSRDGSRLLLREDDSRLSIWETRSARHLGDSHSVPSAIALAPDGRLVARGPDSVHDKRLTLWESDKDITWTIDNPFFNGMLHVTFSPDGLRLATGDWLSRVAIWDVGDSRPRHVLLGHTEQVYSVAFSPDGRLLASGSDDVRLWDASIGEELFEIGPLGGRVVELAFAPDGSCLAVRTLDVHRNVVEVSLHRATRLPIASPLPGDPADVLAGLTRKP